MAKPKRKPLTRTEMKILIYKKVKEGMSYEQARKHVERDVKQCLKVFNKAQQPKEFKEEFARLKHEK